MAQFSIRYGSVVSRLDNRCLSIQTRLKSAPEVFDSDHCSIQKGKSITLAGTS